MTRKQKIKILKRVHGDMVETLNEYTSPGNTGLEGMKIMGEAARTLFVVTSVLEELTNEEEA